MSIEYQPLTNVRTSRSKLRGIAESQVEIPAKVLFEGILDVLASRVGGDRWRNWDELWLSTRSAYGSSITVVVWHSDTNASVWSDDRTWMQTTAKDGTEHVYYVEKQESQMSDNGPYVLYERDPEGNDNNNNIVSSWGELAPARLFSILADAHWHTRKEKLANS